MERRLWGEWDPEDRSLSAAEIIEEGKKVGRCSSFSNVRKYKPGAAPPHVVEQQLLGPRSLQRHPENRRSNPLRRHTSLPALSEATTPPQQYSHRSGQFGPNSRPRSGRNLAGMRPASGYRPASVVSNSRTIGAANEPDATSPIAGQVSPEGSDSEVAAHVRGGSKGSKKVLTSLPEGFNPPSSYCLTPSIALPWTPYRSRWEGKPSPRRPSKGTAKKAAVSASDEQPGSAVSSRKGSKATVEANTDGDGTQEPQSENIDATVKRRSSNTILRRASCPESGAFRRRGSLLRAMDAGLTVDTDDVLFVMSCEERMPYKILKVAYNLFEKFAECPEDQLGAEENHSVLVTQVWRLPRDRFQKLLLGLPNIDCADDLPPGHWPMPFQRQSDSSITFKDFAIWFWSQTFSEEMVLTHEEQEFRHATCESGLDALAVDRYKHIFDQYATQNHKNQRVIGIQDFGRCISELMKIPADQSLPASRIKSMWMQADLDSNGVIDFYEFITFYAKNFDAPGQNTGYRRPSITG